MDDEDDEFFSRVDVDSLVHAAYRVRLQRLGGPQLLTLLPWWGVRVLVVLLVLTCFGHASCRHHSTRRAASRLARLNPASHSHSRPLAAPPPRSHPVGVCSSSSSSSSSSRRHPYHHSSRPSRALAGTAPACCQPTPTLISRPSPTLAPPPPPPPPPLPPHHQRGRSPMAASATASLPTRGLGLGPRTQQ